MNLFTNRIIQTNNITANSGGWLAPVTVHATTELSSSHLFTIPMQGSKNHRAEKLLCWASAVLCPVSTLSTPHPRCDWCALRPPSRGWWLLLGSAQ